jgi:hypothetical protein
MVVANAQQIKNLPRRKTDVEESQRLMKLHICGQVRGSFQLAEDMQGVRAVRRLLCPRRMLTPRRRKQDDGSVLASSRGSIPRAQNTSLHGGVG